MEVKVYVNAIRRAARYIRSRAPQARMRAGLVLGSGLAHAAPRMTQRILIPYRDIPGFPRTTVSGHQGNLVLGDCSGQGIAAMLGRFHYYEGHSMESIAFPVRVLEYMGLKTLVLTSAVGSMRRNLVPGRIAVIRDHINFMGRNPLRAFHEEEFGDMFPDLLDAYDPGLRRLALKVCRRHGMAAREGVYLATGGPSYETPAEIRAFRKWGADVVGMSVVPEAIAARQMGLKVLALGWVANMASGMTHRALRHPDVLTQGDKISSKLRSILETILKGL